MSGVLHPVGPEPEETYWARRVAVLIALVGLAGLVVALVVNGSSTGSAVAADPSPPPVTAPETVSSSPSPSPSSSTSASASPSARAGASPTPSPTASTKKPAASSTKPSGRAAGSEKSKPAPTGPVACRPQALRTTLTGKQRLKPEQKSTFTVGVTNTSDETCVLTVTPRSFELKIYSGTDRIWSTADCSTAVKKRSVQVKRGDTVTWTTAWNGQRSRKDCRSRTEVPRPGTYFATAQLDGAKPVQLRMILGG